MHRHSSQLQIGYYGPGTCWVVLRQKTMYKTKRQGKKSQTWLASWAQAQLIRSSATFDFFLCVKKIICSDECSYNIFQ